MLCAIWIQPNYWIFFISATLLYKEYLKTEFCKYRNESDQFSVWIQASNPFQKGQSLKSLDTLHGCDPLPLWHFTTLHWNDKHIAVRAF